jgi:hypothetical protein
LTFFCWINNRPRRHVDDLVGPGAARHFLPLPVLSALCSNNRLVEKIDEIINVVVGSQNNVTTASAIATVRSTSRYKFFSPKTDAPAPASSGLCKNFDPINEHAFFALQDRTLKR